MDVSKISGYFEENIFSKYQCGFRKVDTAQHSFFLLKNKKLFQIKENQQTKSLQL